MRGYLPAVLVIVAGVSCNSPVSPSGVGVEDWSGRVGIGHLEYIELRINTTRTERTAAACVWLGSSSPVSQHPVTIHGSTFSIYISSALTLNGGFDHPKDALNLWRADDGSKPLTTLKPGGSLCGSASLRP
jgi:hypothetical protein